MKILMKNIAIDGQYRILDLVIDLSIFCLSVFIIGVIFK